jgi:N-methylhydantoinase A
MEQSKSALQHTIGKQLGMDSETAAIGICEVVDENMANAARVHAVESGKELGEFTMIAFGGAAPLHASRLCEKLDIDNLLIPPGAGVGSAIGFLRAPFGFEAVRGAFLRLSEFDAAWTNRLIAELGEEAERFARAGAPDAPLVREIKAYMRYQGQGWEIVVMLPTRDFVDDDASEIRRLFETEYKRLFGRALDGLDIEIMNWSVQVRSELLQSARVEPVGQVNSRSSDESRRIFDAREQRFVDAGVYQRDDLQSGDRIDGPAVIIERETSTVLTSRYLAIRQTDGCLLLTQKGKV